MSGKTNKIIDKVKYFIGLDDYEEEEYEEVEKKEENLEVYKKSPSVKNNRVVNIHTNSNIKLAVHEPDEYDETPRIVDDIKNRKPVVINLEKLEPELKKQIFDFLNGAIYALEGNIQKVAKDIFILAPNNVEIDGKIKEELKIRGIFPWQK